MTLTIFGMNWILILPDIWPAGNPANLNAGYRILGRIYNSTFKCLVKFEINKNTKRIEGFLLPYFKLSIFFVKAVP
jgi:hypothetical protein